MLKALLNGFLISCFFAVVGAQNGLAQDEIESIDALRDAIAKVVKDKGLPSAAVAFVNIEGVQLLETFGYARLETQMPATPETLYRIGSTSKLFVGLAVLKLVEEGHLSLDAKLSELAPEVAYENPWEDEYPIKLVHLLEHTTGWDDLHLVEYLHNEENPISLRDALDFHPHSRRSRWVPGTRMAYSNSGPSVAAYVVEKITGMPFEDYVQQNFFEPLNMYGAGFFRNENYRRAAATLYDKNHNPETYWNIIMRPSGSVNASISDMAHLLKFFIQRGQIDGKSVLSEKSLLRMEKPAEHLGAREGLELGYGLTNYSSAHDAWQYREHNGAVNNGLSAFAYLPEAQVGYAVLLNSGDVAAQSEIVNLIRNFQVRTLKKPVVEKERELTKEQRSWAGYYSAINPRVHMSRGFVRLLANFKVSFSEDKMHIQPLVGNWTARHYPVSDTVFKSDYTGAMHVALVDDPLAGRVLHMENVVLKPVSGFWVYFRLIALFLWSVIVLSSLVYLIVWALLKAKKHKAASLPLSVHLLPLLASLCVLSAFLVNILAMSDPLENLGRPGLYSIALLVLTSAYPVFALACVPGFIKGLKSGLPKTLIFYFGLVTFLHVLIAGYMIRYDIFALVTWV